MITEELKALNMPPEARALGEKLAQWCDDAAPAYAADFAKEGLPVPQRCRTCAFRKDTMPNGSLSTMIALKCVMERDEFYCHQKDAELPGGERMICTGWAIMVSEAVKLGREPIKCPWEIPEGADVPHE